MERIKHYQSQERKGIAQEGEWIDQDLAVKADVPLIDAGTGKKVIIRMFDFQWNGKMKPQDIELVKSNKQSLFNAHANFIKSFLWKDGLSVLENEDPKLEFIKGGYRIAVACEARLGLNIFEKGNTLQEILKKKKK